MSKNKAQQLINTIEKNDFSEPIENLEMIDCETIEQAQEMFIQEGYKHHHYQDGLNFDLDDCKDHLFEMIMNDSEIFQQNFDCDEDKLKEYTDNYEPEVYQCIVNKEDTENYKTLHGYEIKEMENFLKLVKDNADILQEVKDKPISEIFADTQTLKAMALKDELNEQLSTKQKTSKKLKI